MLQLLTEDCTGPSFIGLTEMRKLARVTKRKGSRNQEEKTAQVCVMQFMINWMMMV